MKTQKRRIIYLIRHAEPVNSSGKKIYLGQQNLPLSQKGLKQADLLSCQLRGRKLDAIFCSNLIRTKQTAEAIARNHSCNPVALKELREINLGRWDGLPVDEVKNNYPDLYAARGEDIVHFRPPGGESFADLRERVIPAFKHILASIAGNIAIVTHAGVNRVILCYLWQLELSQLFSIKQDYGQIYLIQQSAAGFRIRQR